MPASAARVAGIFAPVERKFRVLSHRYPISRRCARGRIAVGVGRTGILGAAGLDMLKKTGIRCPNRTVSTSKLPRKTRAILEHTVLHTFFFLATSPTASRVRAKRFELFGVRFGLIAPLSRVCSRTGRARRNPLAGRLARRAFAWWFSSSDGSPRMFLFVLVKGDSMGKKLYVGNLPWTYSSDDLREMFSPYGNVQSAEVISDRETGRSRGFGFVEMETQEGMEQAVRALHESDCQGRSLTVNEARERTGGGGGGGGGGGHRGGGGGGGRGGYGGGGGGGGYGSRR